jgi:threonine synthase
LLAEGQLRPEDTVVILNTGTGLKYPDIVDVSPPVIDPGAALPQEVSL